MIRKSLHGSFKNRRFESLDVESLLESTKDILDENDFDLYGRHQDGSWVEEFYINDETWTTVFLSVDDSKPNNSVYVKIYSPQNNNSVNLRIGYERDLKRFESELL
jgi:hypothetical protein